MEPTPGLTLEPGDYWMTSPVRARVIVTYQKRLLIEQDNGNWSDHGFVSDSWEFTPRGYSEDEIQEWAEADENVKAWERKRAERAAEEAEITELARDLAGEFHHNDGHFAQARELYDLGWRKVED